jgi:hypothetical protein
MNHAPMPNTGRQVFAGRAASSVTSRPHKRSTVKTSCGGSNKACMCDDCRDETEDSHPTLKAGNQPDHDFRAVSVHASRAHTFISFGQPTFDAQTGAQVVTAHCCPRLEGQPVSSRDKFSVLDRGPLPDAGGTVAQYRFEYIGATLDTLTECACNCCAFVQYVRGFAEINGTRLTHILPGSGTALSPTTLGQDSPVIPHVDCRVASPGGVTLNDNPGFPSLRPTDNVNLHFEFDARTIDTCGGNATVASRLFTLDITGTHPRRFVASGDFG